MDLWTKYTPIKAKESEIAKEAPFREPIFLWKNTIEETKKKTKGRGEKWTYEMIISHDSEDMLL